MKSPYKILVYLISMLICFFVSAQTTYYSIASGNWEDNTSWSLASDGSSGAVGVGVFPGRADNVVIRNGHTITIDALDDNGSAGVSASSLGLPNIGFFTESAVDSFYQTGDITISSGGTLQISYPFSLIFNGFMTAGVVSIEDGANLTVSGTTSGMILLGSLEVASTGGISANKLTLTGNSVAILDNPSISLPTFAIDNPDALLCGEGALNISVMTNVNLPDLLNGATTDQICNYFPVTCPSCLGVNTPTGNFITGNAGPGGVGNTGSSANLSLWLDANEITGVSDGADLTQWDDLSGNGYHALDGPNAPSYTSTGGGNGFPTVNFDNANSEYLFVAGNGEVMPLDEVSVFVVGSYLAASDDWAAFISTSDDDAGNDGWGIAEFNDSGDMNFYSDNENDGCRIDLTDYGNDHIWSLIFNTTDDLSYGYKSETGCTQSFTGPLNYNGGANDDLLLGTAFDNVGPTYFLNGTISEVIVWDVAINEAQRIIVTNYLSSKYEINLNTNDFYDMDTGGNGDFDFDVAGIGQAADGSKHFDAKGPGIIRVWNVSDLDNSEFLFWGHDNSDLTTQTADAGGTIQERLSRVWRVAETGDVGTISLSFDFSSFATNPLGSNLRLLIDRDGDGFADNDVTPVAGSESNDIVTFSNVDFMDGDRFTLGNTDISRPLPVELIEFLAQSLTHSILLNWRTATEQSNDYFLVQKSLSGNEWKAIGRVSGAGTSSSEIAYDFLDPEPFEGISYYRLKQVDFDGTTAYSEVQQVDWSPVTKRIYATPNPSNDFFYIPLEEPGKEHVQLFDNSGKALTGRIELEPPGIKVDLSASPNGIYLLKFASGEHRSIKLIKR